MGRNTGRGPFKTNLSEGAGGEHDGDRVAYTVTVVCRDRNSADQGSGCTLSIGTLTKQTLPIVTQVPTYAQPTVTSQQRIHRNHRIPRYKDVCGRAGHMCNSQRNTLRGNFGEGFAPTGARYRFFDIFVCCDFSRDLHSCERKASCRHTLSFEVLLRVALTDPVAGKNSSLRPFINPSIMC